MYRKEDLVSIIVPVYNVEPYLNSCIDSLINQTYKNLEIIIVDDGSTDNSGRICDEYEKKYSNIKVIHKKNAGLGMARNTGLDYADGEYVTFFDSDDWAEKDMIEQLYLGVVQHGCDMCKGGLRRVTDDNQFIRLIQFDDEHFEGNLAKEKMLPRMIGSAPNKKDSLEMCVCGSLYRYSHIKENNLKFPSERELISEDLVFNIEYMQHANGACTISYCGYNYRLNPNSITQVYTPHRFEACKVYYEVLEEKLRSLNYDDETIYRLQRILFVYIRVCISQERKGYSNLDLKGRLNRIKDICNDQLVEKMIEEYPVKKMGLGQIRQICFLRLIQWKMYHVLYILASSGLL